MLSHTERGVFKLLEWIAKYWLEVVFTLICSGAAFVIRHHVKLIINDKKRRQDDLLESINKKTEITDKNEYIKNKFFEIKKRLDEIDKKIENNTNTKTKINIRRHKKLRITFDFTFVNIFVTGITLLIIFAFYQTGRKLLINSQFHKD